MKEIFQISRILQDRTIQLSTCEHALSHKKREGPSDRQFRDQQAIPTADLELKTPQGQREEAVSSLVSEGGTIFFLSVETGYPLPVPQGWGITQKKQNWGLPSRARGLLLLPQWAQKADHGAKEDYSHVLRYNGICPVKVLDLLGPVFPFFF